MYHDLVDEMSDDPLRQLLDKLEAQGFQATHSNPDIMTDRDTEEAWEHLDQGGAEQVVDFLETMYGFLFDRI